MLAAICAVGRICFQVGEPGIEGGIGGLDMYIVTWADDGR